MANFEDIPKLINFSAGRGKISVLRLAATQQCPEIAAGEQACEKN
jgi:hypothetical protein